MADINSVDERIPIRQPIRLTTPSAVRTRVVGYSSPAASALSTLFHGLDEIVDAERNRGHQNDAEEFKAREYLAPAGIGTEKPKLAKASPTPLTLNPPSPRPNSSSPRLITMPTAMATSPREFP